MKLSITDIRDRQLESISWQIEFEAAFGVGTYFQCKAIEVVSVTPYDQRGLVAFDGIK
jgi:hypothetical protein